LYRLHNEVGIDLVSAEDSIVGDERIGVSIKLQNGALLIISKLYLK